MKVFFFIFNHYISNTIIFIKFITQKIEIIKSTFEEIKKLIIYSFKCLIEILAKIKYLGNVSQKSFQKLFYLKFLELLYYNNIKKLKIFPW